MKKGERQETIAKLQSYPRERQVKVARQICQLIFATGVADVHTYQILANKKTGKLVFVDNEPLYGALLLHSRDPKQYPFTQQIQREKGATRQKTATLGLKKIYTSTTELPNMQEAIQAYASGIGVTLGKPKARTFTCPQKPTSRQLVCAAIALAAIPLAMYLRY